MWNVEREREGSQRRRKKESKPELPSTPVGEPPEIIVTDSVHAPAILEKVRRTSGSRTLSLHPRALDKRAFPVHFLRKIHFRYEQTAIAVIILHFMKLQKSTLLISELFPFFFKIRLVEILERVYVSSFFI